MRTQTLLREETIEAGALNAKHLMEYVSCYTSTVSLDSVLTGVQHHSDGTTTLTFGDESGIVGSDAPCTVQYYGYVEATRRCLADGTAWDFAPAECPVCGTNGEVVTSEVADRIADVSTDLSGAAS